MDPRSERFFSAVCGVLLYSFCVRSPTAFHMHVCSVRETHLYIGVFETTWCLDCLDEITRKET